MGDKKKTSEVSEGKKPSDGAQKAKLSDKEPISREERTEKFYNKNYKKLAVIPVIIFVIALILIGARFATTGDFFNKGISLQGGTTIKIKTNLDAEATSLENALKGQFSGEEFSVRVSKYQGVVQEISIETSVASTEANDVVDFLEIKLGSEIDKEDYSIGSIGSALSESFFSELIKILLMAFVLMAIVVFIYFKDPAPSVSVVLASIFDMTITLAIINLFGIKIDSAGIAAFLMIMDYSIDMNSMLAAKVLKRDHGVSVFSAMKEAFGTGITQTTCGLGATISAYFITNSQIIKQIMLILIIGLIVDSIVVWLQNAALMKIYVERPSKK